MCSVNGSVRDEKCLPLILVSKGRTPFYLFIFFLKFRTTLSDRGFPTRMVYLYYISCLRYTILVGNPRKLNVSVVLNFKKNKRKKGVHPFETDIKGRHFPPLTLPLTETFLFNSCLTITRQFSVMTGTPLYVVWIT